MNPQQWVSSRVFRDYRTRSLIVLQSCIVWQSVVSMGMYDLIKYGRYRMTRPLIDLQELYSPQSVYGFPWDYLVLFLLRNPILPRGPHVTSGWLIGRECCRSTVRLVHAVDLTANTGAWPVALVFWRYELLGFAAIVWIAEGILEIACRAVARTSPGIQPVTCESKLVVIVTEN